MEPIKNIVGQGRFHRNTQNSEVVEDPGEFNQVNEWAIGCKICKGLGFVHPVFPSGRINYSKVEPCVCWDKYRFQPAVIRHRGLNPSQTFDNFQLSKRNQEAYDAARIFAEPDSPYPFVLIYGSTGCGKTHLCQACALTMQANGDAVRLSTLADFFSDCRNHLDSKDIERYLEIVRGWPVLIFDDMKAESLSNWAVTHLEDIIDFRYRESMNGNPLRTFLTTNLDVEPHGNIPPIPPRILSRFSDYKVGKVVLNEDIDHRPGK
ncbi:MAG: DnaA/Hda family protein [Dehalococcoidia bacterium]|nr:DnaA/Hda family protein [Dehalococcoidia bacterium]